MQRHGLHQLGSALRTSELLRLQLVEIVFLVVDAEAVTMKPRAAIVALHHRATLCVIWLQTSAKNLVLFHVLDAACSENLAGAVAASAVVARGCEPNELQVGSA
jgi:hypothetical protein